MTTKGGQPPTCFELSDDGETFAAAAATIRGGEVEVATDGFAASTFIRMGWYDTATPTLRDKNGWPVFALPAQHIEAQEGRR